MTFSTRFCAPLRDDAYVNSPCMDPIFEPPPQDATFPLFSWLPKELRIQIWEEATSRERVVHLGVFSYYEPNDGAWEAHVRYQEKNRLGNPISGSPYKIVVEQNPRLDHPLLTVNREARQAVLGFYRIQMPVRCSRYRRRPGPPLHDAIEMLYINPEHDILQIHAEEPVSRTLIDFLWDLKAWDPKGVGLLKLATSLTEFTWNDLQYLRRSDLMLIRQRQVFAETLSQLQEVWFINDEPVKDEYSAHGNKAAAKLPFGFGVMGFHNVGLDKRDGAGAALQRVYVGTIDPRELIWRWQRLLHRWNICHPPGQVKYRVVMARRQFPVENAGSLMTRTMETLNLGHSEPDILPDAAGCAHKPPGGPSPPPEQLVPGFLKKTRESAVGFWSFPIEAMGEIGEGASLKDLDFEPGRIMDLRRTWPELLVAEMS
jgi:hypothetical protein